jgi:hypothetical protein
MTKEQCREVLRKAGAVKLYRVGPEVESPWLILQTNRPAKIKDGYLKGVDIAFNGDMFRIWTDQKKKANTYATMYKLKVELLDGEAVLWVPPSLADNILPKFGAKTKREMTEEQKQALRERFKGTVLAGKPPQEGTSSPVAPEGRGEAATPGE